MINPWWLGLAAAALLMFWTLGAYNRLMALRNTLHRAFVPVDEALQQRHRLLDRLADELAQPETQGVSVIEALRGAQAQVQAAADALRNRPAAAERAARLVVADAALQAELAPVLAWVVQDAALAADPAQRAAALDAAAQRLAFARQSFNQAVVPYNDAIRQFPTHLIAVAFGFGAAGKL